MSFIKNALQELQQEANTTKQFIERVPFDKAWYKPTETSAEIVWLATHIIETLAWWKSIIQDDYLDFENFTHRKINSQEELIEYFNTQLNEAETALTHAKESDFEWTWSMKHWAHTIFTLPKKQALRTFCMNHHIHHRAQLSIYLRLLDIPMPWSYWPSADEEYDWFENESMTVLKRYSTLE